jgi:hypothetical protein
MSDIDLIDKENEFDEVEGFDEGLDEIDLDKSGKKGGRVTTKKHLKIRRAIEDLLEKKRFRDEIDYFNELDEE